MSMDPFQSSSESSEPRGWFSGFRSCPRRHSSSVPATDTAVGVAPEMSGIDAVEYEYPDLGEETTIELVDGEPVCKGREGESTACDVMYRPNQPNMRFVQCELEEEEQEEDVSVTQEEIAATPPGFLPMAMHRAINSPLGKWLTKSMLPYEALAELMGTFMLVFIGTGVVATATLTGAQAGLWQVAAVWGVGVAVAIFSTASISGAHLNPAVSLAFAIFRHKEFPVIKLIPYVIAQFLGGFFASVVNYVLFYDMYAEFAPHDTRQNLDLPSTLLSASTFGEYFPNPGFPLLDDAVISPIIAMTIEAVGTAFLMFVILSVTDPRNSAGAGKLAPAIIGFTVAILISVFAPYTMACWNPARDFGPRVMAAMCGWGSVALPGPRNGFWVYLVGPTLGAPLGALLYDVTSCVGLAVQAARKTAKEGRAKEQLSRAREMDEF